MTAISVNPNKNTNSTEDTSSEQGNAILLQPSTVAMFNILQLIFSQIGYKEGQGEIQMTKTVQETGVQLAQKVWRKGLFSSIGQGILGTATLAGGATSLGVMANASGGAEIESLEGQLKNLGEYQEALSSKLINAGVSDATEEGELTIGGRNIFEENEVDIEPRVKEMMNGEDLDLDKTRENGISDKETIDLMSEQQATELQENIDNQVQEKRKELQGMKKTSVEKASAYANAASTLSQGIGNILKAGLDVASTHADYESQLLNQAKQLQDKTIQDLDHDRMQNVQTLDQLQQLSQSTVKARTGS